LQLLPGHTAVAWIQPWNFLRAGAWETLYAGSPEASGDAEKPANLNGASNDHEDVSEYNDPEIQRYEELLANSQRQTQPTWCKFTVVVVATLICLQRRPD
jgi:nucleosome binding factor SPN SPT16 subunit